MSKAAVTDLLGPTMTKKPLVVDLVTHLLAAPEIHYRHFGKDITLTGDKARAKLVAKLKRVKEKDGDFHLGSDRYGKRFVRFNEWEWVKEGEAK